MKNAILALAALAACVSAQVTYDNGTFTCSPGGGAYCAGGNIIIRCTGTVGQPGNCNDNLAGEPPLGVSYAPCVETSPTSGDAACSKNGTVYPGSGATEPLSSSASAITLTTTTTTKIPTYSNSTSMSAAVTTTATTVVVVTPPAYTSTATVSGTVSLPVVSLPPVTSVGTVVGTKTASVSVPLYTGAANVVEGKRILGGLAAVVVAALAL